MFCLRYLIPDDKWPERAAKTSFWSLNIGLAWMSFATLFPLGMVQLYESVQNGYYQARSLEFLTNDTNALIEWIRLPGDILFIGGGVLPLLYICFLGVRYRVSKVTQEEPGDILFTETTAPAPEATAAGSR
jgi:nitric oxide reductase subunit B